MIVRPDSRDLSPGSMEMAVASYSADDLAEMRARRILLNDPPPIAENQRSTDPNKMMLEIFVRRNGGRGEIRSSPIPEVYAAFEARPRAFEAVSKLFAVLFLRLGAVVQTIHELDIRLEADGRARVHFVGERHRVYENRAPAVLRVDGALDVGKLSRP